MQETDWRREHRYEALLATPWIREYISQAAACAPRRMSAGEALEVAGVVGDLIGLPGFGFIMQAGGAVGPLPGRALGLRVRRTQTVNYPHPVGKVLVAVSCALAREGYPLQKIVQGTDGCVLEADMPSNWLSWKGSIVCVVSVNPVGTTVRTGTRIPGQVVDWGRSNELLSVLGRDTQGYLNTL